MLHNKWNLLNKYNWKSKQCPHDMVKAYNNPNRFQFEIWICDIIKNNDGDTYYDEKYYFNNQPIAVPFKRNK